MKNPKIKYAEEKGWIDCFIHEGDVWGYASPQEVIPSIFPEPIPNNSDYLRLKINDILLQIPRNNVTPASPFSNGLADVNTRFTQGGFRIVTSFHCNDIPAELALICAESPHNLSGSIELIPDQDKWAEAIVALHAFSATMQSHETIYSATFILDICLQSLFVGVSL